MDGRFFAAADVGLGALAGMRADTGAIADRLIARMESAGARVIVMGPDESGKSNEGLREPSELGKIPASFNGYIWVEDIWSIGPSLKR